MISIRCIAAAGFTLIGLITVATADAAGPEPGLSVIVNNPASQPVPVTLQGTGSITGSVTVTNTPSVTVTNTPNVSIVNEPSVRDGDNPAFQPVVAKFRADLSTTKAGGNFFTTPTVYTVPDGKRLVVEYVDVEFTIAASNNSGKGSVTVFDSEPGVVSAIQHPVGITPDTIPCTLTQVCATINRSLRTYASAGAQIFVEGVFNATQASVGSSVLTGTVNGYLVDVP